MTAKVYSEELLEQEVDLDNLTDEQFDAIFGESLAQAERDEGIPLEEAFDIILAEIKDDIRLYEAKKLKKSA